MLWDPALDDLTEQERPINEALVELTAAMPTWDDPGALEAMRGLVLPGQEPLPDTEVIEVPTSSGSIEARIQRPPGTPRGALLDIHGGGWVIGSAAGGDRFNRALAHIVGVVTVSPEYRLAPEHPWPAAADDCEAVARWLVDHAGDRFGTDRLLVAGGSAGAHLAMVTLLRLRDAGLIDRFDAANLVAGVFDVGLTPSQRASADGLSIPLRVLEACNRMTFPGLDREQRRDPSISPLYADLHGLPPALLTVGTRDPLLDDSLFLHRRLQAAGVDAELAVFPDGSHTFVTSETPLAEAAKARIHAFLDTHLA